MLLRVSVAGPVLLEAYSIRNVLPGWVLIAFVLLATALSMGLLTPMVAMLALAARLLGPTSVFAGGEGALCMTILSTLALAMLGPGAYSIDARRFGRRVLILPPHGSGLP